MATLPASPGASGLSPGGWKARTQARVPSCGSSPGPAPVPLLSPVRMAPLGAVAGVGSGQVHNGSNSPAQPQSPSPGRGASPSGRGSYSGPSTSRTGPSPSARPMNAPLNILFRAAAEARVTPAPPAELSEVTGRLAATQSWPAMQMLAVQYQGRLDQQSVVAVLRRAAKLASDTAAPTSAEQYACARFLESIAMSCASLIPNMTPPTVAAVLGTLGTMATSGLVVLRQVPYMVVALVQALILASLPQLHFYSGPQLAFVLRGCALLSPSGLPEVWLDEWQTVTTGTVLRSMQPDALEAVVASLQTLYTRQNWMPQDEWLGELLQVVEGALDDYDGAGLRHLAVALAGLEVRPHNGWLGSFRAVFDRQVAAEEVAPSDVAGVLYAFTKLQVAFGN